MAKINSLSPAQVERLGEFRDKWIAAGLQTGPCDRKAMEQAVDVAYAAAGLKAPGLKIWLGSPLAGAYGALLLTKFPKNFNFGDQVWAQVGGQVGDQVRDQVWAQVGAQVGDQVRAQVGAQVRAQVGDQVRDQVWDQVGDQVRDQVGDQVGDQVWDQVWDQVYRCGYGQHDAGWLAFYDFFGEVCGLEIAGKLSGLNLLSGCGWWWPFQGAVILTERPTSINRDTSGRLHSLKEAAIKYPDGFAIHAVHGVRVPEYVIERPEEITLEKIGAEQNAEIRRVMIEVFGYGRYLSESKLKLIDERPANDVLVGLRTAKLWRDDRSDDPIILLDMLNSTPEPDGSIKRYVLSVDPEAYDGRASRDVLAAMASTWRKSDYSLYFATPEAYRPFAES